LIDLYLVRELENPWLWDNIFTLFSRTSDWKMAVKLLYGTQNLL